MSETPIALLQRAAELGLKLGSKPGDVLTVQPGEPLNRKNLETIVGSCSDR